MRAAVEEAGYQLAGSLSAPLRVAAFVAGLAALFGVAAAAGAAVGPLDARAEAEHATDGGHGGHGGTTTPSAASPTCPAGWVSQDGYTLALDVHLAPGRAPGRSFAITGPDGAPVTSYEEEHGKELHLIAVRRDLTGYQHVHPVLDADGRWSVAVVLAPAQWRLFADFTPTGGPRSRSAPTSSCPARTSPPRGRAVAHGTGRRLRGHPRRRPRARHRVRAHPARHPRRRAGHRPRALPRRLRPPGGAARGRPRLPARAPRREPGDGVTPAGPEVTFVAEVPSAGGYRLFLDFQHDGAVHTAAFPVVAT